MLCGSLGLTAISSCNAALITSDVGYDGPGLNLSAYENGSYNFTFGPESLPGGITLIANPGGGGNSGEGSVIGQGPYGLGTNGSFGDDAVYIGVDSGTGYAELIFDEAISFFGGYFNYAPGFGDNATISVFDDLDNMIESWDLTEFAPISTPDGFNEFVFRGIDLGEETFSKFRFGGNYILLTASEDGSVVDDEPMPDPDPVPAPTTSMLFGLTVLALVYRARKLKDR